MRKVLALFVTVALVVVAAGCAKKSGKDFRQVAYSYTGGIAGFDRSITIANNGSFQIKENGKNGRSGRLTSAELQAVRQLVNGVNWANVGERYIDARVADAIIEDLTVDMGKVPYHTRVGTGGEPPADLAQLMGKLRQILDTQK